MLHPSSRLIYRSLPFRTLRTLPARRPISTEPPAQKSRSWKSSATRWGLAVGGIYYYNNSDIFAEEPPFSPSLAHPAPEDAPMPTLESLALQRTAASPLHSASSEVALNNKNSKNAPMTTAEPAFEETEEEVSQEGAFNEETGEINWDCPCLGGMAHGPCGDEFRAAFSCFVYSKEEPKGMDCIDRFKGMQDCFRAHPEHYPDEIADPGPEDEASEEQPIAGAVDSAVRGIAEDAPISSIPDIAPSSSSSTVASSSPPSEISSEASKPPPPAVLSSSTPADVEIHPAHTSNEDDAVKTPRAKSAAVQAEMNHRDTVEGEEELVPKEWHDTRNMNEEK